MRTWLRRQPAPRPKRASCALRLELLEERTLPATINWIAGSGAFDVGSNWSGGAGPRPNDVAVIDTGSTAARIAIQPGDTLQVQAINTATADTLSFNSGALLTVTVGTSTLNGPLSMSGGALTVSGSGVNLTANGTTTLTNANLFASGGAQLSLPKATTYVSSATHGAALQGSC